MLHLLTGPKEAMQLWCACRTWVPGRLSDDPSFVVTTHSLAPSRSSSPAEHDNPISQIATELSATDQSCKAPSGNLPAMTAHSLTMPMAFSKSTYRMQCHQPYSTRGKMVDAQSASQRRW